MYLCSLEESSRIRFRSTTHSRHARGVCSQPLGDSAALKAAEETAGGVLGDLKMEFGTKEPSLSVRVRGTEEPAEVCVGKGATHRLLSLLDLLPHGVMKISHDVEGLVSRRDLGLGSQGADAWRITSAREPQASRFSRGTIFFCA